MLFFPAKLDADGSPFDLDPDHVSVQMLDMVRFDGMIKKGEYQCRGKYRRLPWWMEKHQHYHVPKVNVYILLKSGFHFESTEVNPQKKGQVPAGPLKAYIRLGEAGYFTTKQFHEYNACGPQYPGSSLPVNDNKMYVAMPGGPIWTAYLEQHPPKDLFAKGQTASSSPQKYKKRRIQ